LWFTLPPQWSLLVSWLFSVIPIPCLKILFFTMCAFLYPFMGLHSQTGHIDNYNITTLHTAYTITTWSIRSEEVRTAIVDTLNRVDLTEHTQFVYTYKLYRVYTCMQLCDADIELWWYLIFNWYYHSLLCKCWRSACALRETITGTFT